ncbi:hypothetical protein EJ05DRAFT_235568 [Pseudovirgaria hyperparasitica]|uniref:P-loop containing nucleoside triphosphate hydrolase protein n=1 Tax=Pseudovirgaria hyperparasitica TaxID=470096 RepID=A0A6A6VRT0_9PEZI|nr:uncharacterized protein EJ05DRAFT_235568 [Pseudovirgaria hyperparasitica]KAF2752865.1 hypothetical protein EJ05DRAFT_235568 [Pseudovirgaria hyperparasitica]
MASPNTNHKRNFLLTIPRSGSNLLVRILNLTEQPDILRGNSGGGYYFFDAHAKIYGELRLTNDVRTWSTRERELVREALQSGTEAMIQHIDSAEQQGKSVYIKEHMPLITDPVVVSRAFFGEDGDHGSRYTAQACGKAYKGGDVTPLNVTLFSDSFLKTIRPTFLIRHPLVMFPSYYRAHRDLGGDRQTHKECSLKWSRSLYDWFVQNRNQDDSTFPTILDADDFIAQPEFLIEYSQLVGLDASKLLFEWNKKTTEELEAINFKIRRMTDTLNASSGIIKGKVSLGLNIEEEVQKWKEEFGEEKAARLEKDVRAATEDYEYLKARRFRSQKSA